MFNELTEKQSEFIKEYRASRKPLNPEYVMKGFITLFLEDRTDKNRQHTAWLINRIKPQYYLPNMDELLDMQEIKQLAYQWQSKIDMAKKFAQKRRHERRGDFALSEDEWIQTVTYFNGCCAYCGSASKITYDHFVPFSKGGSFTQGNIIPACKSCNSSKNNNDFKEWYSKQPFYSEERQRDIVEYIEDIRRGEDGAIKC